MGLPSEDRPSGAVNGSDTFYDDEPNDTPVANGQEGIPHRPHVNMDNGMQPPQAREAGSGVATPEQYPRERRAGGRRPSTHRICGKCQRQLTGQFVRALGDTYHLECFTCHVRLNPSVSLCASSANVV